MDKTQQALKQGTEKWLAKLEARDKGLQALDPRAEPEIENLRAYIKDCYHFMEKGDWVRAFEACVYAWGILETLEHLKLVE
ncbi:MAG: DUF357 domain-containing protein [Candidatus Aenigmatarchaeota archaeon]